MPAWSDFAIASYAKYLDFHIGPGATAVSNFQAPGAKLLRRSSQIAAAPISSNAAVTAMNREAIPTIGYVAQLVELPPAISNLQAAFTCKSLKIPYRTLGCAAFRLKTDIGITAPLCLTALRTAIHIRTAKKTLLHWHQWYALLCDSFFANASLVDFAHGPPLLSPSYWQSKPAAQVLFDAQGKDPFDAHFCYSVDCNL